MMRTILTSTAAVLLATGTAFAADWDMNDDGLIDEDEYRAHAEDIDLFAVYDLDDDDVITQDEFYSATFQAYDQDNDGMWSQTEAGAWDDSKLTSGAERDNN